MTTHAYTAERQRQPVRRNSHKIGLRETSFWRGTSRQEVQQIVLAARRYELDGRKPGERSGPLGAIAIEVLDLFANLVDFRTGRLEPAIVTIMGKLKRSRDAIVRALAALRDHGFIDWLRRYEPTGAESGPQVIQTSNAYRLSLPERARAFVARWLEKAPIPEDIEHARAIVTAERHAYAATLSSLDLVRDRFDADSEVGKALARLAIARQNQPLPTISAPPGRPFHTRPGSPEWLELKKERESVRQTECPVISSNRDTDAANRPAERACGGSGARYERPGQRFLDL